MNYQCLILKICYYYECNIFVDYKMDEFLAGITAGAVQTIIGHPFDTLKVNIQNKKQLNKLTIKKLYRGCMFPFFSGMLLNGIYFPVIEETQKYTDNYFISGAIGGMTVSPSRYVFDVFTIKSQIAKKIKFSDLLYARGLFSLTMRESIGLGMYAGVYKYLKEDKGYNTFLSGAVAGFFNWGSSFPIDTIKNRQIGENMTINKAYRMGNLWSGFSYCGVRAILINGTILSVYEYVKDMV